MMEVMALVPLQLSCTAIKEKRLSCYLQLDSKPHNLAVNWRKQSILRRDNTERPRGKLRAEDKQSVDAVLLLNGRYIMNGPIRNLTWH
jgi:hypothetical protein